MKNSPGPLSARNLPNRNTTKTEESMNQDIKSQLKRSDVKVLFESELLKIMGEEEVEKVLVNDLNEDQEYELFVDVVVIQR